MLKAFACRIAGHQVDRHRVWHDGINYRTNCTRCATALLRAQEGWREFDPELDSSAIRLPHPRFDTPAHK